MSCRPVIIGCSALPVGRHQTPSNAEVHVVEHELLARLVVEAMADSGAERERVGAIVWPSLGLTRANNISALS